MNDSELKKYKAFLMDILTKAGDKTYELFGTIGVKYTKSNIGDVVTEADLISNRMIMAAIKKNFPEHGVLSEEVPELKGNGKYLWIVDPIDGTRNYATRIPLYGVQAALAVCKNGAKKPSDYDIVLSCVYLPAFKELYVAEKGLGTYLNGKRIYCNKTKKLHYSIGLRGSNYTEKKRKINDELARVAGKDSIWANAFGSMAVESAYIASGRRDWYIIYGGGGMWDFAPVYLILKESGCKVTDLRGKPWKMGVSEIVAANPLLHKQLLNISKPIWRDANETKRKQ